ncbi:hypothetical protein ABZ371_21880, partial [Streptomyces sp. NPDC005899]|uniref:hypothetical protein n=1 Tax=Streptomyces sp. NPDC005899 TaxID=3155716 RepID=UPI003400A79C
MARGTAGEPPVGAPRPRAVLPWLRVVGATAAVCGVLAAGAFAVTSAGREETAGTRVADGPTSPARVQEPPADPSPGGAPPAGRWPLRAGGVVDPHSNRYWAQSNVTVEAAEPLSALTVELRIALNGGVNSTGSWRSLPEEDFDVSVREEGAFLVYRWTLKPGRGVRAGTHTFAGQYNHTEGTRDAGHDGYTALARVTRGEKVSATGEFAASP